MATPNYELRHNIRDYFERRQLCDVPSAFLLVTERRPELGSVSMSTARYVSELARREYDPDTRLGSPTSGIFKGIQAARMWAQCGLALDSGVVARKSALRHSDRMYRFAQRIAGDFGLIEVYEKIYEESAAIRMTLNRATKKEQRTNKADERQRIISRKVKKHKLN